MLGVGGLSLRTAPRRSDDLFSLRVPANFSFEPIGLGAHQQRGHLDESLVNVTHGQARCPQPLRRRVQIRSAPTDPALSQETKKCEKCGLTPFGCSSGVRGLIFIEHGATAQTLGTAKQSDALLMFVVPPVTHKAGGTELELQGAATAKAISRWV